MERSGVEEMTLELSTILKLAKLSVDKYSQSSTQPGFVTTQNGQKIKVRFSELSAALEDLSKKDLEVVRRCKDCDNWHRPPKGKIGSCFPKDHTCGRNSDDYCSKHYTFRSAERRACDEAVAKLSSKK